MCAFVRPYRYITTAVEVDPDKPVLVDKYLDRAIELDVDALRDKEGNIVICGIMEHIEQVRLSCACTYRHGASISVSLSQLGCVCPVRVWLAGHRLTPPS